MDETTQNLRQGKAPAAQAALVRAVLGAALAEPDRPVLRAVLGTALAGVELGGPGAPRAGVASRIDGGGAAAPQVPQSAHALAAWLAAPPLLTPGAVSLGLAAVNALLPVPPGTAPGKGQELLLALGQGARVVVVGHFPFVERMGEAFAALSVLELAPRPGDLPAARAAEVLPEADMVAITGTSLQNGTLGGLLALCRPGARVVLLGPSTPLVPALLDMGIDVLAGAVARDPQAVLDNVARGLHFRHQHDMDAVLLVRENFFGVSS